jgi:hypothetical protein
MKRKLRKNINGILVFLLILSNFFATPFIQVKAATDEVIFTEGFETGTKSGYGNSAVKLSSGDWYFESALIDGSSSDKFNGKKAARTQKPAAIYMTFDVTDVKDFKFKYATFGTSDKVNSWTVLKSTDSGSSWVSIDTSSTITGTLTESTISVNQQGKVRFKIAVSAGTGTNTRLNIDDVTLTKISAVVPPVDDTTPPTVTANPTGGTYTSEQSVTLTASEAATIYYTLDGADPTTTSTKYTQPINISNTTTLKFMAIDTAGNQSTISTERYILEIIDITPPTVSANPKGGSYTSEQSISLSASELATIYYTLDGTNPTVTSSIYSEPITISSSKTLKFIAVDTAENQSTVYTETYTIDLDTPAVTADKDALAISYGDGDISNSVTKNITLPVTGQNGSTITWSSNDLAVVTNDGLVTRPSYGTGDKTVTLTATIQKGTASATKPFTITVKQSLPYNAIFIEGFESSLKTAFTSGTVTLPSGDWTLDEALIGNLGNDKKNGNWSVRARSNSFYMNFDVSNVKDVIFSHANYGSDKGARWILLKSIDEGVNWVEISSSTTITETLSPITIPVNQLGKVRFKVQTIGSSTQRINFDDFVVIQMEQGPLAPIVNPVTDADTQITGSSEPASTVTAKVNEIIIGGTTTSNDGAFSITIPKQQAGTVISLIANNSNGIESNSVDITVSDATPPPAPFINPVKNTDVNITGTAEIGSNVIAKVDGEIIGTSTSNNLGQFTISIAQQPASTTIVFTAIDSSQNESIPTEIIVENDTRVALGWTEDTSSVIFTSGKWYLASNPKFTDESLIYSVENGVTAELTFYGSGIRWIALTSPFYGLADVYIDGEFVKQVNLYSSKTLYSQLVFEELNLEKRIHTIKLINKGIPGDLLGKGTNINIDAFNIFEDRDPIKPETPTTLIGKTSSNKVILSWNSSKDIDLKGYNIYRSLDNETFVKLNSLLLSSPNFVDDSTEYGKNYFYKITAIDTADNESESSLSIGVYVTDPATSWTEDSSSFITTTGKWNSATNTKFTDYSLVYSGQSGASAELTFFGSGIRWFALTSPNYGLADVYIDDKFVKQVNLYSSKTLYSQLVFEELELVKGIHTIKLVNKGTLGDLLGKGTNINIDALDIFEDKDPKKPETPTSLIGRTSSNIVILSWNSNKDLDLMGYNIYRSLDNETFVKLNSLLLTSLNFMDDSTEYGKNYFYKITAVDTAGNESDSSSTIGVYVADPATSWTEDSSSLISITGKWKSANNPTFTDNSLIYSGQSGATAEFTFYGSGIRWFALTSAYYGLVDVYIDGEFVKEVNLYSINTLYKQLVFEEINLEKGIHTIKLVNKGVRGALLGKDSNINIDALDVIN